MARTLGRESATQASAASILRMGWLYHGRPAEAGHGSLRGCSTVVGRVTVVSAARFVRHSTDRRRFAMQVRTVAVALSAALFAAIATRAEEKPNLTGTWTLNLKTSKLSDGKPIPYYTEFIEEIDHKEPKLKIVEKIKTSGGQSDRTVVWDLTTGGKETEADVTGSSAKADRKSVV